MKRILVIIILLLLGASVCSAQTGKTIIIGGQGKAAMRTELSNGLGISYVKVGDKTVGALTWHPDLRTGYFGLGLNVNVPLGEEQPQDFENIVVRYAEYDTGYYGLRYGTLDNITLGYGLLMANYSTVNKGAAFLHNRQGGLKIYAQGEQYGFESMATWTSLYGFRLTERPWPWLILGQTVVADADGVTIGTKSYPSQSGYGLDAAVPLWDKTALYAEYARLNNHGSGFSAGLSYQYNLWFLFSFGLKAERRIIDTNFVPGYFNSQYETNPVDLASVEATPSPNKNGYLVEAKSKVLGGLGSAYAIYESYEGSNATLVAEVEANLVTYSFSAGIRQPNFTDFRSLDLEQGAIYTASVGYRINPYTQLITHYKKAYDPTQGKVVESEYFEIQMLF